MEALKLFCKALAWTILGVFSFAILAFLILSVGEDAIELIKATAWPATVILAMLLVAFSKRFEAIFGLLPFLRKITLPGLGMEFSLENVNQARAEIQGVFSSLLKGAKQEYDQAAAASQVSQILSEVLDKALPRLLKAKSLWADDLDLRVTVHVPDIVLTEYLYQLVDYAPSGGGSGRLFGQRFGIIGRSWRLEKTIGDSDTFDETKKSLSHTLDDKKAVLIKFWGMTKSDLATRKWDRPSCLAVLLRNAKGVPIGILYVDSAKVDAFGDGHDSRESEAKATAFACELAETAESIVLASAVEEVMTKLRLKAPSIDPTKIS